MPSPRPRIVSLLPSATEIVCALGFRSRLVGRSHECDFPPDVAEVPVCTRPRFDVRGTSREIDDGVKRLLRDALSLYEVDEHVLARLHPTVIVTQTQCEVCAVSPRQLEQAVSRLAHDPVSVVSLSAVTLDGIFDDVRRVASALAADSAGSVLVGSLRSRVSTIARRAAVAPARPRVACIEWLDPLMAAGNWIPELVAAAGGEPVLAGAGTHAPGIGWDDLATCDPDAIVVMPCGFGIARTVAELERLEKSPQWSALRAVRQGRVFVTDANQFFSRPGPRIVDSLEILAEILSPDAFSFGREGRDWVRRAAAGYAQSNA